MSVVVLPSVSSFFSQSSSSSSSLLSFHFAFFSCFIYSCVKYEEIKKKRLTCLWMFFLQAYKQGFALTEQNLAIAGLCERCCFSFFPNFFKFLVYYLLFFSFVVQFFLISSHRSSLLSASFLFFLFCFVSLSISFDVCEHSALGVHLFSRSFFSLGNTFSLPRFCSCNIFSLSLSHSASIIIIKVVGCRI